MKILLYIFLLSWFIFFSWMGYGMYSDTPEQIKRDSLFIKEHIDPSIAVIESFRKVNGRLPTSLEFHEMRGVDTANLGDTDYTIENDENYHLAVWRGDGFEYYNSLHKEYKTNSYTYADGIMALILCILAGLLPLAIWRIVLIRRNRIEKLPPAQRPS